MLLNINFGHIPSFGSRDSVGKLWLKFDILKCHCDLENKVKVTKTSLNSVQVWSKSTHWFRRYDMEKADFYSLS